MEHLGMTLHYSRRWILSRHSPSSHVEIRVIRRISKKHCFQRVVSASFGTDGRYLTCGLLAKPKMKGRLERTSLVATFDDGGMRVRIEALLV